MQIGDRLREIREARKLSQGDIEKRTGLFRPHISRIENSQTVPAIETLEKMARALEVPLYQLFYDGNKRPELATLPKGANSDKQFGLKGKEAAYLAKLRHVLSKTDRRSQWLLLKLAHKMAKH